MHISDSTPFILMVGSSLFIPRGIKKEDTKIPLCVVERAAEVYHFIEEDSSEEVEMTLTVPPETIPGESKVKVTEVDFQSKTATAVVVN